MEMKRNIFLVAGIFAFSCSLIFAAEEKTIKGEVVDVSCYVAEGAKGAEHETCALACLQAGEPAGILEEGTGKVYIVVTGDHSNPAKKVIPFVAKMVEATGTINAKGGIETIDIKEIKEIKQAQAPAAAVTNQGGMKEEMPAEKKSW